MPYRDHIRILFAPTWQLRFFAVLIAAEKLFLPKFALFSAIYKFAY